MEKGATWRRVEDGEETRTEKRSGWRREHDREESKVEKGAR
jgi:hypothetical protein